MNTYIDQIHQLENHDQGFAVARVVQTWGSSPRPIGSMMWINAEGKMVGSVSGGCVEGAVVKSALQMIAARSNVLESYGVSDEDAWSVGLSCGGSIKVLVQYVDLNTNEVWKAWKDSAVLNQSSVMVTAIDGPNKVEAIWINGNLIGDKLDPTVVEACKKAFNERKSYTETVGDTTYFLQVFPRKAQLLVIGAAHITVDLVELGQYFGFETIVIDPRNYFVERTQFSTPPDQLYNSYPSEVLSSMMLDAYTFCAILSHDPKIDDDALQILLPSEVAYIGALGSKKTHEKRKQRLLNRGFDQASIDRIQAPIGLSIHAKSAREIALSIIGEIIAFKNVHL